MEPTFGVLLQTGSPIVAIVVLVWLAFEVRTLRSEQKDLAAQFRGFLKTIVHHGERLAVLEDRAER